MILRPGDIFLSAVPGIIGSGINLIQRVYDKTSHSIYSHAGIIIDPDGTTFEAQWRVTNWNLFEQYDGVQCLVARHDGMNERTFKKAFDSVKHHLGRSYAFYRILFHLFPIIAKQIAINRSIFSIAKPPIVLIGRNSPPHTECFSLV